MFIEGGNSFSLREQFVLHWGGNSFSLRGQFVFIEGAIRFH